MDKSSRRRFLVVTGAGAAAVGAVSVAPVSLAAATTKDAGAHVDVDRDSDATLADSPLVVCVNDLSTGEVVVIDGDEEICVTDPDLVRHIVRLAQRKA